MRTDIALEDFISQAKARAKAGTTDKELIVDIDDDEYLGRRHFTWLYERGFSIADAARYTCLMTQDPDEDHAYLTEDYCIREMKKISDRYPNEGKKQRTT